jgi:hypothetical protein
MLKYLTLMQLSVYSIALMDLPNLSAKVELTLGAKELPSKDTFSKSDPMAVLLMHNGQGWARIDRTEAIQNNENPTFEKRFMVDYQFEATQRFRVEIYDVDSSNLDNLAGHDFIGYAEFNLGRLMSTLGNKLQLRMTKPTGEQRSKADIVISGYQVVESRMKIYCNVRGLDLDKKGFFGKDDTQLQLVAINPNGSERVAYQSEVVHSSQDPVFRPFKACLGQLAGGDMNREFIVRVMYVKDNNEKSLLGEHRVTAKQLSRPALDSPAPLYKVELSRKNKNRGQVYFDRFHVVSEPTFLDFVTSGLDFRLITAIDFTGSNGPPADPNSLHHLRYLPNDPRPTNQYIDVIRSIGGILSDYARKDLLPVYGFGGHVSIDNGPPATSHCFPITRVASNPYVPNGVQGIEAAYADALQHVRLSGPTNFQNLIEMANATAMEPFRPDYQHYTIMLIITDGAICDMNQTVDAIVRASDKPMSIVIVGVGAGDFSSMEILDGDGQKLRSNAGEAKRDIVQFVPFRDVMHRGFGEIARVTLQEIPNQLLDFMKNFNIQPVRLD